MGEPADREHPAAIALGDIDALRPPTAVERVAKVPPEGVPRCRARDEGGPRAHAPLGEKPLEPDPSRTGCDDIFDGAGIGRLEMQIERQAGHGFEPRTTSVAWLHARRDRGSRRVAV